MVKKIINFFIFIAILNSTINKACSQTNVLFDSIVESHPFITYIIGETHPPNVRVLYKNTTKLDSLLNNYADYRLEFTSILNEKSNLQQVVIEFPVFMEYYIQKYKETNEINWLNCITFDSKSKKEIIEYFDYLNNSNVHVRCIDIPVKYQLSSTRLSLLNILLETNNIICYTDSRNYIQLDSLLCNDENKESSNCKIGNFHNLKIDSLQYFKNEIQLLIEHLNKNSKNSNAIIFNFLQNSLINDSINYKNLLTSNYLIYTRILQSLSNYIEYKDHKGWRKKQYREEVLTQQLLDVSQPNQLVIVGNSHVYNITPILYKRRKDYINFYEILKSKSFPMIPSVTFLQGINSDSNHVSLIWEKDMKLLGAYVSDKYIMKIYSNDIGEIRIVTNIITKP